MAQFDVYKLPRDFAPFQFGIEIQTDFLRGLPSRVIAPLVLLALSSPPIPRLNPVLNIDGKSYVTLIELLEAVPVSALKSKIANVSNVRTDFVNAIDFLLTGY